MRCAVTASRARSRDFEGFRFHRKTEPFTPFVDDRRDPIVLKLDCGAAAPADQKLADMRVIGVGTGDKGLARLKSVREAMRDEKIEAAINAGSGR